MLLDEVPLLRQIAPKGWQVQGRKRKVRQVERKGLDGTPVLSAVSQRRRKRQKTGKSSGSAATPNVAEEEVEEEEIEDGAMLSDKRSERESHKKKGKAQPAGSAAHEADAAVDDDGFGYSAVSSPCDTISSNKKWCLKGAKGVSTFNFANGQKALAREKCRIWLSYEPPLFTDFSIIDEGKVPFLTSLPQMKNLGVSLDGLKRIPR